MSNSSTKRSTTGKSQKKRKVGKRGAAEPTEYIEKGREVLDLAAGGRNDKQAARQVLAVIESETVPRWLRETVVEVLAEAARRIGSPHLAPVLEEGKVTVLPSTNPHFQNVSSNLADLICFTNRSDFSLRLSERAKLAHAISTILNSEETPVLLYNCVGDFVTDISTPLLNDSPEVIEKALALGEEPLVKKRRVRSALKGGSHAEQAR